MQQMCTVPQSGLGALFAVILSFPCTAQLTLCCGSDIVGRNGHPEYPGHGAG